MNKLIYISLFLLAVASCTTDNDSRQQQQQVISFTPKVNATRAVLITEDNIDNVEITATRSETDGHYFTDVAKRTADGTLAFTTPRYWLPGAPLNFYAITQSASISDKSIANGTFQFDYSASADDADILIGFAYNQQYTSANRGIIPVKFSHTLALVEFAIAYDTDTDGNKVAKVEDGIIFTELALRDMAAAGHCTANSSSINWTTEAPQSWTSQSFVTADSEGLYVGHDIFAGDLINTPDRSKSFVIIPGQTLNQLRVSFIEGRPTPYTQTIDITPTLIEPGKRYVFNLAIKSTHVSLTGTRITDWVSSNSTDITFQ